VGVTEVLHFSEDPGIDRFDPHVPATNPSQAPRVWAIDEVHAPLYWFPRGCPRVAFWTQDGAPPSLLGPTAAARVHAVEAAWLDRIRACRLVVYRFDAVGFEPWSEADGHWVAHEPVVPRSVTPVGDLLTAHAEAGIELRVVPSLHPLVDPVVASGYRFSIVRLANAQG
jgi:hypothetical protein